MSPDFGLPGWRIFGLRLMVDGCAGAIHEHYRRLVAKGKECGQ